jgi:hypothetical protein
MGAIIRDGIWYGGATVIDNELSTTSENPVQNKIITTNINQINTNINNINNSINQITPSTLEYNNTSTYAVNDYCIYNNTLYRCITDISTAEDFTPAHWISISVTSDLTEINNTIGDINTVLEEVL